MKRTTVPFQIRLFPLNVIRVYYVIILHKIFNCYSIYTYVRDVCVSQTIKKTLIRQQYTQQYCYRIWFIVHYGYITFH